MSGSSAWLGLACCASSFEAKIEALQWKKEKEKKERVDVARQERSLLELEEELSLLASSLLPPSHFHFTFSSLE